MMAGVRAFIAIQITNAIVERVVKLQQVLRHAGADIGWTLPGQMHLTLKFLGDVSVDQLPVIAERLEELTASCCPFALAFMGTGGFPNMHAPRVLWVGVGDGASALRALANAVDDAMRHLGFPCEARPFHAHLTLGRVHAGAHLADVLSLMQAHAGDIFGTMLATEVRLMRSELSPCGANHTLLHVAAFRGRIK